MMKTPQSIPGFDDIHAVLLRGTYMLKKEPNKALETHLTINNTPGGNSMQFHTWDASPDWMKILLIRLSDPSTRLFFFTPHPPFYFFFFFSVIFLSYFPALHPIPVPSVSTALDP